MNKRSSKGDEDILKINNLSEQMIPLHNFQRKRLVHTSKTKNRPTTDTRSFSKTFSRLSKNQTSQMLRQQTQQIVQFGEQKVKTFDKLQLQDFIKVFITGNDKLSAQRQQQIIKSLNGTWFKNLNNQRYINNYYSSLPLKKQRDNVTKKKIMQTEKYNYTNEYPADVLFLDNYKHPNLFPKRKSSPRMLSLAKAKDLKKNVPLTGRTTKPLFIDRNYKHNETLHSNTFHTNTLSRSLSRQNSINLVKSRRSSSGFSRNKSMNLSPQNPNNCLFVKKMLIHD